MLEEVVEYGINGFLFTPNNHQELAKTINKLLY
jgi:hypothetical protein